MSEPMTRPALVRPRRVARLADDAVRATLATPRTTILWCGLLSALLNGVFTAFIALATGQLDTTSAGFVLFGSLLVWLPVMLLGTMLLYSVLAIHAAHRVVLGEQLAVWACLLYLLRPRVLLTVLMIVVPIVIGSILLVVPGVLAMVLLAPAIPVMVAERRYLFDALGRSVGLMTRTGGAGAFASGAAKAFALLLVVIALSMLMTFVFQIPMQVITQGLIFRDALSGIDPTASTVAVTNWIALPFTLVTAVVSIFVYSFGFHAVALLYLDSVERAEAPALQRAVESLRHEPAVGSPVGPSPGSPVEPPPRGAP